MYKISTACIGRVVVLGIGTRTRVRLESRFLVTRTWTRTCHAVGDSTATQCTEGGCKGHTNAIDTTPKTGLQVHKFTELIGKS
jgi:hypothetical protein